MISLEKIDKATSIVILTDDDSFCNASALYTYILRLHKKVSLVSATDFINLTLSCVPWYEKVKKSASKSADLTINMQSHKESIFKLFKQYNVQLNQKMATALYADYLQRFTYVDIDSLYYADMSVFIENGAQHIKCNHSILGSQSLSLIRLKSYMYRTLLLADNATVCILYLEKKELIMSGASFREVEIIMQEVLSIVNVKICILLDSDNENKLIKYKEIKFE